MVLFRIGRGTLYLDGVVSIQNSDIWGTASSNVAREQSLYPHYIIKSCCFIAYFILGPFSSEENTPRGPQWCSITGSRYCDLLQQQVFPALQERECSETTVFM
ncbi:hypothetical protein AVEN_266226-1 [Araneus ventricosus]|uniref:Uncharacterized protein n=1 Tax=Araneus ventricosus TaxID=182803 RepID=A0A4Y2QTN8_ARAVE|nr:hypothetical protein AVEN_266226-1 [Araneus ventricosus]